MRPRPPRTPIPLPPKADGCTSGHGWASRQHGRRRRAGGGLLRLDRPADRCPVSLVAAAPELLEAAFDTLRQRPDRRLAFDLNCGIEGARAALDFVAPLEPHRALRRSCRPLILRSRHLHPCPIQARPAPATENRLARGLSVPAAIRRRAASTDT
jgi:hypothetical protein